jgi:hypothetical protein
MVLAIALIGVDFEGQEPSTRVRDVKTGARPLGHKAASLAW